MTDFKVTLDHFHLLTLQVKVDAGQDGCYSADDVRSVSGFCPRSSLQKDDIWPKKSKLRIEMTLK